MDGFFPTQGRFVDFYFFVRNRVIVGEKPSTPSLFPKIDQLLPLKYPHVQHDKCRKF